MSAIFTPKDIFYRQLRVEKNPKKMNAVYNVVESGSGSGLQISFRYIVHSISSRYTFAGSTASTYNLEVT